MKSGKRVTAFLLAIILLISNIPFSSYADEAGESGSTEGSAQVQTTDPVSQEPAAQEPEETKAQETEPQETEAQETEAQKSKRLPRKLSSGYSGKILLTAGDIRTLAGISVCIQQMAWSFPMRPFPVQRGGIPFPALRGETMC